MSVAAAAAAPEVVGVNIGSFNGGQAPWPLYVVPHGISSRVLSIRYRVDLDPAGGPARGWVFEYLDIGGNVIFQLVPATGGAAAPGAGRFILESFGLAIPLYQTSDLDTPGTGRIAENSGLPDLWLDEGSSLRFNSIPVGDSADVFSGMYLVVQQETSGALAVDVPVYLVPEPPGAAA